MVVQEWPSNLPVTVPESDEESDEEATILVDTISIRSIEWTRHIDDLPPELLLIIFDEATQDDHRKDYVSSAHEGPWLLSKICRRWRSLSLCTPRLWSSVRLVLDVHRDSVEAAGHLLSLQLLRSQDYPLYIMVDTTFPLDLDWRFIAFTLFLHHRQWKVLEFNDEDSLVHNALCYIALEASSNTPTECPALEQLKLDCENPEEDFFATFNCPYLKKAELALSMPAVAVPVHLPWIGLEELHLCYVDLQDFLTGSHDKLVNLKSMKITRCHLNAALPNPCTFPNLRILDSILNDPILDWITAPVLESITGCCCDIKVSLPALSLISRSQCPIRTFSCNLYSQIRPFLPLLETLHTLRELQIAGASSQLRFIDIVQALKCVEEGGTYKYCPQLQYLDISIAVFLTREELGSFLDMVERRAMIRCNVDGQPLLRSVKLSFHNESGTIISDELAGRVSALRDGGVSIVVCESNYLFKLQRL